MKTLINTTFALVTALLLNSAYSAQPPHSCVTIDDDQKRLQCYDNYFTSEDYTDTEEKIVEPQKNNIGFESKVRDSIPDMQEFEVMGSFKEWKKGMKIKFTNGQVWKIVSHRSVYNPLTNPKVKLKKGALGSYFMVFDNINSTIKVKRIK